MCQPTTAYVGRNARNVCEHLKNSATQLGSHAASDQINGPVDVALLANQISGLDFSRIDDHNIPPSCSVNTCSVLESCKKELELLRQVVTTRCGLQQVTADSPITFDSHLLLRDEYFLLAASRYRGQQRIQEYIATLRLRIHRQLSDKRWSVFTESTSASLDGIIEAMTGGQSRSVTVIDCSMLAHDVLPFFCAVFGRMLLELRSNAIPEKRTVQPYVLVLEEAHNYLKAGGQEESAGLRLAREAFERIAKEGRKFGLSLFVASQRPSDISPTVISQCANFLVHRIQSPEDIDYFRKILPLGSRAMLDQLPILGPGAGLMLGSAVNVPTRVKIQRPKPAPSSDTARPWVAWQSSEESFDRSAATQEWLQTEQD